MTNLITSQLTHFPRPKYFLVALMVTLSLGFCDSVFVRAQQPQVTDNFTADSVRDRLADDSVLKAEL